MVLKPAVRSVVDWKNAAITFCGKLIHPSVSGLVNSTNRISSVPLPNNAPVITKTSRLCSESRVHSRFQLNVFFSGSTRRRSNQTAKPRPPVMIRPQTVKLISGSVAYAINDDRVRLSSPALQNAETERNTEL